MTRLPTLFVSHGAPGFAVEPGRAGPQLARLGRTLPKPAAVLIVSPHWMTARPRVTSGLRPETLHDFGGFDPALYEIRYPASGDPVLAARVVGVLRAAGLSPEADDRRGLDHGAWVPLIYLYPEADVPVLQVSMPVDLDARTAWAFGEALAPLAEEGVLIIGSGSLTHNLREFFSGAPADPYVDAFVDWVRRAIAEQDRERLLGTLAMAPQARRAHPTPEHFWPLLMAAGAAVDPWPATLLEGGIDHRVLAMDAFVFGQAIDPVPDTHRL